MKFGAALNTFGTFPYRIPWGRVVGGEPKKTDAPPNRCLSWACAMGCRISFEDLRAGTPSISVRPLKRIMRGFVIGKDIEGGL